MLSRFGERLRAYDVTCDKQYFRSSLSVLETQSDRATMRTRKSCSRTQFDAIEPQKQKNAAGSPASNPLCRFTSGSRFYILNPRANNPNGSAEGIGTNTSEEF